MALDSGTFAFANAEYLYNIGADAVTRSVCRTGTTESDPVAGLGDLVGWIEDLSGNNRDLVLATTPKAELAATHGFGGKRSLYTLNKDIRYQCTTTLPAGNDLIYAAVIYAPPANTLGNNTHGCIWSENAVKNGFWKRNGGSNRWAFWATGTAWSEAGTTPTLWNPTVLIWRFEAGVIEFWKDGATDGTGSTYNFTGTTPNVRIFHTGNSEEFGNMHLGFLGRWDGTALDAEVEALADDLAAAFAIDSGDSYAPMTTALVGDITGAAEHIQGVGLTAGAKIIAVTTNEVHRYSADMSTKEEEVGSFFTGAQDHAAGGPVHNGKVYVLVEDDFSAPAEQRIITFTADDLADGIQDSWDISAQDDEVSGLVIVPGHGANGVLYHCDFNASNVLQMYDLVTPTSYLGTFATGIASGGQMQGVGYIEPFFFFAAAGGISYLHEDRAGFALLIPALGATVPSQGIVAESANTLLAGTGTVSVYRITLSDYFFDWPLLESGNEWNETAPPDTGNRRRRMLICGAAA